MPEVIFLLRSKRTPSTSTYITLKDSDLKGWWAGAVIEWGDHGSPCAPYVLATHPLSLETPASSEGHSPISRGRKKAGLGDTSLSSFVHPLELSGRHKVYVDGSVGLEICVFRALVWLTSCPKRSQSSVYVGRSEQLASKKKARNAHFTSNNQIWNFPRFPSVTSIKYPEKSNLSEKGIYSAYSAKSVTWL